MRDAVNFYKSGVIPSAAVVDGPFLADTEKYSLQKISMK